MVDISPLPEPSPLEASTSAPRSLCAICDRCYSIYTCPRCTARTCSLSCSLSHKSTTGCNGERNKAAYVPMNQYGWGTMMNDYVFLEEVGRQVGDWGKEIVKGGMRGTVSTLGARLMRGGNRRGGGRGGSTGHTKRDMLKIQLEARDIDMELLPLGMERQKINQSYWEPKNQTAFLTIEFRFHPPRDPLAPSAQPVDPPFVLLTHRNNINTPLLTLAQHVTRRVHRKKDTPPEWIKYFITPHPDDPESFCPPQFLMTAELDPHTVVFPISQKRGAYYRFDPSKNLAVLLKYTRFVEFPIIELWGEFNGTVVDTMGAVTQQPEEAVRPPNRRRTATEAGRKAINGLLGGYGSDEEEKVNSGGILSVLDEYTGSDNEDADQSKEDPVEDENVDRDTDDDVQMDPIALLELLREGQGSEKWVVNAGEDDLIDMDD